MDLQNMIQQFTGGGNTAALEQAVEQHIAGSSAEEVTQHLQTAAANANASGQPDIAQQIEGMIARKQVDPEALKDDAVAYIKSNPQVLTHFAPPFAQGILNRVL